MARLLSRPFEQAGQDPQAFCDWAIGAGISALLLRACLDGTGALLVEAPGAWLAEQAEPALQLCLQWSGPRPAQLERLIAALASWMGPGLGLRWGPQPVLVLDDPPGLGASEAEGWIAALAQMRAGLAAQLGLEPLLLAPQRSKLFNLAGSGFDGAVEDAWRDIACNRSNGRLDFEGYLFHADHRPAPSARLIPAVLLPSLEQRPAFCSASSVELQDWISANGAWSDLWHWQQGGGLVLVEPGPGLPGLCLAKAPSKAGAIPKDPGHQPWFQSAEQAPTASPVRAGSWCWGEIDASQPALLIHAFHLEILEAMLARLAGEKGGELALYVSTPTGLIRPCSELLEQQGWTCVRVFGVPNRGRDIAPFVRQLLPACAAGGHPWFVKVHTKRSSHLHHGQAWGEHLHGSLLNPENLASLAAGFKQDPGLGLIAPAGALQPLTANLSANGTHLQTLLAGFDLDPRQVLQQRFAAGSMGAMRTAALAPLIERIPPLEAFEHEAGQTDGTLAHAIERLLGLIVQRQGYTLAELNGAATGVPDLAYQRAAPRTGATTAAKQLANLSTPA